MVYLIYGNEPFKVKYQMSKLTEGYDVRKVEKITQDVEGFLEVCGILSTPCVVYESVSLGADEALLKLAKKHAKGNARLLITAKTVKENTKLFAFLKEKATIIKCDKLNEQELIARIVRGVKHGGCEITKGACMSLISRSGYMTDDDVSLYAVNNLVKQLTYCGDVIEEKDVEAIVSQAVNEDSRELISLLCAGNIKAFMEKVLVLAEQSDMVMICGSLIRNFRIAFKASLVPNASGAERSKMLGLNSYQLKYVQPLFKVDGAVISECLQILADGSADLKRGLVPQKTQFVLIMGKLCEKFQKA